MKIRFAALFGALLLVSASALAFHCPADMKKIDEALAKNPKLSAQQAADVKKFRADGETLHKAGKHQESVDTLAKAGDSSKARMASAVMPAFCKSRWAGFWWSASRAQACTRASPTPESLRMMWPSIAK